jgi:hypothetical protein
MTLPTGSWTLNADGLAIGTLAIGALGANDGNGNQPFTGTATFGGSAHSMSGYWDEAHQEIYFLSQADPTYANFQVFRGNLFSFGKLQFGEVTTTWTLAGDLRLFSMSDNAAAWNTVIANRPGLWCAQITTTQIIIEAPRE